MAITVSVQVIILFLLITVGFVLTKADIIKSDSAKCMTDICLTVVTPCVIIKSFSRPFDKSMVKGILLSLLISFAAHIFFIVLSRFVLHDKDDGTCRVLRFGAIFSNCGFMAIPILESVLGDDGVFYGSAFLATFNVITWTYGVFLMSGDKKCLSFKKVVINPGIIGIVLGLAVFLSQVKLPGVIASTVSYIAALNTPLPMIIIGYYIATSDISKAFKNYKCFLVIALRQIIMPMAVVVVMHLLNVPRTVLMAMMLASCAPTAATTTMFSAKFDKNTELSVSIVALSTFLSILTIPLMTYLTELIIG